MKLPQLSWWLILRFVAAVFLAVPVGMIGYAGGGAIIGGVAVSVLLLAVMGFCKNQLLRLHT